MILTASYRLHDSFPKFRSNNVPDVTKSGYHRASVIVTFPSRRLENRNFVNFGSDFWPFGALKRIKNDPNETLIAISAPQTLGGKSSF